MRQFFNVFTSDQEKLIRKFNNEDLIAKQMRDMMLVVDYALYDRIVIPANCYTPEVFHFYSIPIGIMICPYCQLECKENYTKYYCTTVWCHQFGKQVNEYVKTKADTNMVLANRLANPQSFCNSKSLYFLLSDETEDLDISNLFKNYYWELRLGMKTYNTGPLGRFPNCVDFSKVETKLLTAPPTGNKELDDRNKKWIERLVDKSRPDFRSKANHQLNTEMKLVIEQDMYFSMQVVGKPFLTTKNLNFMSVMEGLMALGVQ